MLNSVMSDTSSPHLEFPRAQQAQIIRANQRDLYHGLRLREQVETVVRSWMGSRWLTRWDKELDLCVKLCYFGLTTGRAMQTLGEEYTDIRQYSSLSKTYPVSRRIRVALVILSLFPPYALGRWGQASSLNESHPKLATWLRRIPSIFDVAMEVNLAVFYMSGTYYDPVKRLLGIQHLSLHQHNPYARPPSYSLLGILITIRLLYRLAIFLRESSFSHSAKGKERISLSTELYLDDRPVSLLLEDAEDGPAKPAEQDERTALDITAIPDAIRASRTCTLCLEERTDSCTTECGHMFCWNCIVGWGREKPECPLCRQSLSIDKLLPIYNL